MYHRCRRRKGERSLQPEVNCPVCGIDFEVPAGKGEGDSVECPYCLAQLRLVKREGKLVAEEVK